jgi:hypothetical protein
VRRDITSDTRRSWPLETRRCRVIIRKDRGRTRSETGSRDFFRAGERNYSSARGGDPSAGMTSARVRAKLSATLDQL